MQNNKEQSSHVYEPTLRVNTLDPSENRELEMLLTQSKLVLSDIDYTLLDIAHGHASGVEAVSAITSKAVGSRLDVIFHMIIEGHRRAQNEEWEEREEFDHIMEGMERVQGAIIPQWGVRIWSKESMIILAAEDVDYDLDSATLIRARDAYWKTRTEKSLSYPYTKNLYSFLDENKIHFHLFTGSNSVLHIADDMSLSYEPEYSAEYKRNALASHLPPIVESLIIGDPIDKPDPRFFEKVNKKVQESLNIPDDKETPFGDITVVGDSLRNDLEYFGEKGAHTVLIEHS